MRKIRISGILIIGLFLLLFSICGQVASAQDTKPQQINWVSYLSAVEQSKSKDKPLFLYWYAEWCKYCKQTKQTSFKDPAIITLLNTNFIPVAINVEKNMDLVKKFRVTSLPTFIVINITNDVLFKHEGFLQQNTLLDELKKSSATKAIHTQAALPFTPVTIQLFTNGHNAEDAAFFQKARDLAAKDDSIEKISDSGHPQSDSASAKICTENICSLGITDMNDLARSIDEVKHTKDKQTKISQQGEIEYLNQTLSASLITLQGNIFTFILTYWLIGILIAFTPCTFPLLILIFGLLTGSTEQTSYRRTIYLTLTYIVTLSLSYAVIGLLSGVFGIYLNAYFQLPIVLILFSAALTFLAFSLIGVFSFKLPFAITHYAAGFNRLRTAYTYPQVITMGIVAMVIMAPCMAAPLFTIIGVMASSSEMLASFLALLLVGLGIGTPLLFFVIAGKKIFSTSQEGMHLLKTFLGITILGVVISIITQLVPPTAYMIAWSVLFFFTAIYLFTYTNEVVMLMVYKVLLKCIAIIFFLYACMLFVAPFLGSVSPFNPLNYSYQIQDKSKFTSIRTLSQLNETMSESASKPALVLFTADWCSACMKLKKTVIANPYLQRELSKFRLYEVNLTTIDSPQYEIARKYHIIGQPEVIFFYSNGKLSKYRVGGMTSIANFEYVLHTVYTADFMN